MGVGWVFSSCFNKDLWLVSSADVVILTCVGTKQDAAVSPSSELQIKHVFLALCIAVCEG